MTTERVPVLDRIISREYTRLTGDRDGFNQPIRETVRTPGIWASRRDFTATDRLRLDGRVNFSTTPSRWTVRAGIPWRAGNLLIEADGNQHRVTGIAQVGRGRYVELYVENVG